MRRVGREARAQPAAALVPANLHGVRPHPLILLHRPLGCTDGDAANNAAAGHNLVRWQDERDERQGGHLERIERRAASSRGELRGRARSKEELREGESEEGIV